MVWDIPPSNMLEVRHRIYTEAEKRFLDYIDIGLKDEKNIKFQFEMHRLICEIVTVCSSSDPRLAAPKSPLQRLLLLAPDFVRRF